MFARAKRGEASFPRSTGYNGVVKQLLARLDDDTRRARDIAGVGDDVAPWIDAGEQRHAEGLIAVLELAAAIAEGSGREADFLQWQDSRSEQSEVLWLQLVAEYRRR
jgi:hypothetical protein